MSSFDVDGSTFADHVVARSHQTPVLVDFWAQWCAPCRSLAPVLEKLVADSNGQLALAKVDTDACPELAGQFGIRSLPTVILFVEGKPVDQFSGALPESQIRQFLQPHLGDPADAFLSELDEQLSDGLSEETAIERLRAAVDENPRQISWVVRLCELYIASGYYAEVRELLSGLTGEIREDDRVLRLSHLSRFAEEANASSATASENEQRFTESSKAIVAGSYETGMDILLELIANHRDKEDATEAAMRLRGVFHILGHDDPLVREYRSKMSSALH